MSTTPSPVGATTVLAVANQKGGVAKTTSVASIGAALAEQGQRVLLVDLDPQACLTFSLGIDPEDLELSIHHVLTKGLHPADKQIRVANFHNKTIEATKELMEACGFKNVESIDASKFFRRISEQETRSFREIYFLQKENPLTSKFQSFLN